MRGTLSTQIGVLLFDSEPSLGTEGLFLESLEVVSSEYIDKLPHPLLTWDPVSGKNLDDLIAVARERYGIEKCFLLFASLVQGLSPSLEGQALCEIEESLQSQVPAEKLLNRILVAPLLDADRLEYLTRQALSQGLGATANVLRESSVLQVSLRTLTDAWLRLDDSLFEELSIPRGQMWQLFSRECAVLPLLNSTTRSAVATACSVLLLALASPRDRTCASSIITSFANQLYPHEVSATNPTELPEAGDAGRISFQPRDGSHTGFVRALREIDEIVKRISRGEDNRARKYLFELIARQADTFDGRVYAVKSLCNIAQRCVEMYRFDFEELCLKRAIDIDSRDAWTLVQYGNHLKRKGEYQAAIRVFTNAGELGDPDFSRVNIADVYTEMGEYSTAVTFYRNLSGWQGNPSIRTALADIYRYQGDPDRAEKEYRDALSLYSTQESSTASFVNKMRPRVGLAEVEKYRGNLESSLTIYNNVLDQLRAIGCTDEESESALISSGHDFRLYCLARAHVLKRLGRYTEALRQTDEVLGQAPFSVEARLTRSSILGLLEREEEGLSIAPFEQSEVIKQWRANYYRGLLNLRLDRFEEARAALVDEAATVLGAGRHVEAMRFASAVYFLKTGELSEADSILDSISTPADSYARYLLMVIRQHACALRDARIKTTELFDFPDSLSDCKDRELCDAIECIKRGDFDAAIRIESSALLKLTA